MNKILRFSLVALMAIVFGNVYADEATIKYTGGTTTNMTGENDAALVGLDASAWSVVGDKGTHEQFPGLNKDGSIRLYWKEPTSNTITVSSLTGATINSIKFTFIEGYENVSVTVGGNLVSATDGTYAINSSSFILGNANTSSKQVRFTELVINYTPAGGGGGSVAVWKADDLTFDPDTKKCNEMVEEPCTNENIFIVSKDTKIYPAGTHDGGAVDVVPSDGTPLTLTSFVLNGTAGKVTMKAVSTPNHNDVEEKPACGWERAGSGTSGLNTNKCDVKFEYYVKPKSGNPSMLYGAYTEYKDDGVNTNNRVKEDFWNPELNKMPVKGLYYEFTSSTDGELVIAILVWRPGNKLYFFDKETFTQFPTSALSIEGYVNNNTVVWGNNAEAFSTIPMTENHDYQVEGIPSSKIFGYMKLNVKANKTYVLLSSNSQPGIYGFYLNEDPTSVETIKTNKVWNADAPMYNLSGQKVDKSYKGIVIQNGRKFVNK